MKQYSLSMHMAVTEISENFTYLGSVVCNDHGSSQKVVPCIGLPTALWTHSARVFGVFDTCADEQRFGSSSRW